MAFRTGIFAALFSALGHDVAHPGRNNAFLVKTKSVLALRYNDVHVLENMHASTLFQILQVRPAHAAATNNQAMRSVAKPASRCPCSRRRKSARTRNHNLDERNGVVCLFVCLLLSQDPDTNILGGLSDEQRQTFRRQSVSMVTIERHVMPQLSTVITWGKRAGAGDRQREPLRAPRAV